MNFVPSICTTSPLLMRISFPIGRNSFNFSASSIGRSATAKSASKNYVSSCRYWGLKALHTAACWFQFPPSYVPSNAIRKAPSPTILLLSINTLSDVKFVR